MELTFYFGFFFILTEYISKTVMNGC